MINFNSTSELFICITILACIVFSIFTIFWDYVFGKNVPTEEEINEIFKNNKPTRVSS